MHVKLEERLYKKDDSQSHLREFVVKKTAYTSRCPLQYVIHYAIYSRALTGIRANFALNCNVIDYLDIFFIMLSSMTFFIRFSVFSLPDPFPWNRWLKCRNASFEFINLPLSSIYSSWKKETEIRICLQKLHNHISVMVIEFWIKQSITKDFFLYDTDNPSQ